MRIAICDCDNIFAKQLKHKLYLYSNKYKLELVIDIFSSGEKLLNSPNKYALIFIEYDLPGINGLKTAHNLRKNNKFSKIIFTSHNTDIALEVFCVSPFRFLKKPIKDSTLEKTLSDYLNDTGCHYAMCINNGSDTFCINTNEILYLEACNKYCYIHLNRETILCKKTMARVYDALPKFHFQKINRAFVVNLEVINKYNTQNVDLKNGETLHITRTYFKDFKKEYLNFLSPVVL